MIKYLWILFTALSTACFAQTTKPITLEDIFIKGLFSKKEVEGLRSMKDGKTYVAIETDPATKIPYVARNNYRDGKQAQVLFTQADLTYKGRQLEMGTDFNEDESKVIIGMDEEQMYRRSSRANYYVFDLATKQVKEVSPNGKQFFATLSPDGTKVAFVRDNNIFIHDLAHDTEKQITNDGEVNHIINGLSDWVYEEEFEFAKAFFWNADGTSIAYYRFDETEVPEFSMTMYERLYPAEYRYKYPKAGEKNSVVSIHIYHLTDGTTKAVDVGTETDQYLPRVKWTRNPAQLCVLRMNRHQNKLEYLFADAATGRSRVILTEEDKCYIDINDDLTFLKDGKRFIICSERNGFNHLYLYSMDGTLLSQLTQGNWEVTAFYGIDEKNKCIYYQSTEFSPLERDVYRIGLNGKGKQLLSTSRGTNSATFSADYSYYILNHADKNTPNVITLLDHKARVVRVLEDNAQLQQVTTTFGIQPVAFIKIPAGGTELNAYILKPAGFDASKKYPVLMYVYGGPGSQMVANAWGSYRDTWFQYLAQQGYIIVCVDNRGTGFRGADFKKSTYLNLGKEEVADQIEAARWLGQQPYVDVTRIGIWGWSYGGYMSSLCITKGADVFKMAIAVAPVTNWRFYDSIYTERYLRSPNENAAGYDENSPINFADRLKGKFLLVHGTGDDNVHFQNSVMFSEAFIQANKPFEQAYYPNKNHGINGGYTTLHLYNKLSAYILNNL
ncbi:dipeptidyl-peptidase-4 [bacterium A37T11]|nr:dipeptidyl-peptidase-4 [bacterium A37T11]